MCLHPFSKMVNKYITITGLIDEHCSDSVTDDLEQKQKQFYIERCSFLQAKLSFRFIFQNVDLINMQTI